MQTVKTKTSKNYQDYLLSALSDSERIAKNIEVVLEDQERLSGLLRLTLTDIIQAKVKNNNLSKEAQLSFEKLDQLLAKTDGQEIYTFIDLLSNLGLKLSIISDS